MLPGVSENIPGILRNKILYFPLGTICKEMDLDYQARIKELSENCILKDKVAEIPIDFPDGKTSTIICLPSNVVHGWLFQLELSPNEKPTEKFQVLQEECFKVLDQKNKNDNQNLNPAWKKNVVILQKTMSFKGHSLKILSFDFQYWFWAKDVCDILKINSISDIVDTLEDDELAVLGDVPDSQADEWAIINESGLFRLIFESTEDIASVFKKWINAEILTLTPNVQNGWQFI